MFVFSFLSLLKVLELLEYVIYICTNSCILQINNRRLIYASLTSYSFKCIQETMLFMEQVMFCFDMNKTFVHSDSSLSMGKGKFDLVEFASKINRHSLIIDRSLIQPIKFHRSSKCKLKRSMYKYILIDSFNEGSRACKSVQRSIWMRICQHVVYSS